MILVALGANLEHPVHGAPRRTCEAALKALESEGISILARSRWYASAPVPPSDQPWFVNGVVSVRASLSPSALLARLHQVEAAFGRERRVRDEARVLDLDLLAYDDIVSPGNGGPVLPHPRMAERAFVVLPLAEIAPDWRHPVSGLTAAEMARRLAPGAELRPLG